MGGHDSPGSLGQFSSPCSAPFRIRLNGTEAEKFAQPVQVADYR